jgi:hypothetical protein
MVERIAILSQHTMMIFEDIPTWLAYEWRIVGRQVRRAGCVAIIVAALRHPVANTIGVAPGDVGAGCAASGSS